MGHQRREARQVRVTRRDERVAGVGRPAAGAALAPQARGHQAGVGVGPPPHRGAAHRGSGPGEIGAAPAGSGSPASRRATRVARVRPRPGRRRGRAAWKVSPSPGWRAPRRPARSPNAVFGEPLRQVCYKAAWHGKRLVAVGRWSPSGSTCGARGHVNAGRTPGKRAWAGAASGATHDRGANVARNLKVEGEHRCLLRRVAPPRLAPAATAGAPETGDACGRPGRPPTGRASGPTPPVSISAARSR